MFPRLPSSTTPLSDRLPVGWRWQWGSDGQRWRSWAWLRAGWSAPARSPPPAGWWPRRAARRPPSPAWTRPPAAGAAGAAEPAAGGPARTPAGGTHVFIITMSVCWLTFLNVVFNNITICISYTVTFSVNVPVVCLGTRDIQGTTHKEQQTSNGAHFRKKRRGEIRIIMNRLQLFN